MAKLIVVVDKQDNIKAAAIISPENEYSPTMIEVKSGESMHEVTMPDELEAEELADLVNYKLSSAPEPRLVRQPAARS